MSQYRDKELLSRISARLKGLREKKGVSQEQVYFDTDIHIGRIETGQNNLTVSTLSQLCNYFDISLSEFFKDM